MRFRKTSDEELPERLNASAYVNVRSNERVDVRPGETKDVSTGIEVKVGKGENASVVGEYVVQKAIPKGKYVPLIVTVLNTLERNIMIYPGMSIAGIKITTTKKTTIASTATLVNKEELVEQLLASERAPSKSVARRLVLQGVGNASSG